MLVAQLSDSLYTVLFNSDSNGDLRAGLGVGDVTQFAEGFSTAQQHRQDLKLPCLRPRSIQGITSELCPPHRVVERPHRFPDTLTADRFYEVTGSSLNFVGFGNHFETPVKVMDPLPTKLKFCPQCQGTYKTTEG